MGENGCIWKVTIGDTTMFPVNHVKGTSYQQTIMTHDHYLVVSGDLQNSQIGSCPQGDPKEG